ncbi:MAG TPA: bifunctional riboflavin kinase/FAD synthetase [Dehalococcoidia bacterium]|nr:bifunctional riboflavin kinase/FAD synthetase [Dehalococcoidia bacterium]
MQIVEELAHLTPSREVVLTIGVFDGVHLGHRHLLGQVMETARELKALSGVVTFQPHPRQVIYQEEPVPYLCGLEERVEILKSLGIDLIATLSFTPRLARMEARQFVSLIQEHLRMRELVVGPDFALGRGREGDLETLTAIGEERGFGVRVVKPLEQEGLVVSSTSIRRALAEGDVVQAASFLGRPVSLFGPVISGARRGKGLGFPTANLQLAPDLAVPANGVYVTRAYLGSSTYPSVTNIGHNPTFGGRHRTVEVHLLDFDRDLYGQTMRIELLGRLREEKRFSTVEELIAQMHRDVAQTRRILEQSAV